MNKPNLKIIYCEENKKFAVVDVSSNSWYTINLTSYDLETAIAVKKAYEDGYKKGIESNEVLEDDKQRKN